MLSTFIPTNPIELDQHERAGHLGRHRGQAWVCRPICCLPPRLHSDTAAWACDALYRRAVRAVQRRFDIQRQRQLGLGGWLSSDGSSRMALKLILQFLFEIISPIAFTLSLLGGPLRSVDRSYFSLWKLDSNAYSKLSNLSTPTKILAGLYLVHCWSSSIFTITIKSRSD